MEINLKNIEELIFFDKKLQDLLPEYRHIFDQWQIGQRVPGMKSLGQRSVFELLNSLGKKEISVLQNYFNDIIVLNRINNKIVDHYQSFFDDQNDLCQFFDYKDFCLTMDKDKFNITFWR
jgi:hypothetical protein